MVAYVGNLGSGQQVYVENQGTQTIISLMSSSSGQQQNQSTSFQTGTWVKQPTLFRNPAGFILQIEATEGFRFVRLQANAIGILTDTPSLSNVEIVPLQESAATPGSPMQPMQPMQPMKPLEPLKPMEPMRMGDMEMRLSPNMEMRMGNMQLRMGSQEETKTATKRFCTQCGNAVSESDRFCSHCGHRLG